MTEDQFKHVSPSPLKINFDQLKSLRDKELAEVNENRSKNASLTLCSQCNLYFPRNELDFVPKNSEDLWCIFCLSCGITPIHATRGVDRVTYLTRKIEAGDMKFRELTPAEFAWVEKVKSGPNFNSEILQNISCALKEGQKYAAAYAKDREAGYERNLQVWLWANRNDLLLLAQQAMKTWLAENPEQQESRWRDMRLEAKKLGV